MKRRAFLAGLGGATAAWPTLARAQQAAIPVIGFLNGGSPARQANILRAFQQGMNEIGYVEGSNVAIEYRWANDDYNRLPALVADLIRSQVAVIAATTTPAALAAKAATAIIPIVFETAGDPVMLGLVTSLNKPNANLTGVTQINALLVTKRLGLIKDLMPASTTVGFLVNPKDPRIANQSKDMQDATSLAGLQLRIVEASTENDFAPAFATLAEQHVDALIVASDVFLNSHFAPIIELAARYAIPAIYQQREAVVTSGLMSYGTSLTDAYRQAGVYTGRVLKGEKPSNLPVVQPTKFEFVINLKTARTLGLTIPSGVISIADEVIE